MTRAWPTGPWSIRTKLIISLATVNLIGTIAYTALSYRAAEMRELTRIDKNLCRAAESVRKLVPETVINQIESGEPFDSSFAQAYVDAFDEIEERVEAARLDYVYVIAVRPDGTAYEIVSNLNPVQQAERMDPLKGVFGRPYQPPPLMTLAVSALAKSVGSATDAYGSFRSCLVPVRWTDNRVIVFGADLALGSINNSLRSDLIFNLAGGLIVVFAVLVAAVIVGSRFSRELDTVVAEANDITRLRLGELGRRDLSKTLEVDLLHWSLDDVRNGLRAFSKYVPDVVIGQLIGQGIAKIGGERRELSLLMSEVEDYKAISEAIPADQLMTVMSEYFEAIVGTLLREGAIADKFMADQIFTYWNAPALHADHAIRCCRAALAARRASENLAGAWRRRGRPAWRTRFGLHAGEAVFGNVGAPDRMDFTVVGSAVNLCSRLVGLNKYYGTAMLASGRLRDLAGDGFLFRSIDMALPKGAIAPLEIVELIGAFNDPETAPDQAEIDFVRRWTAAIALFRTRDFNAALPAFETLRRDRPDDPVVKLYVKRTGEHLARPPPSDWDGVQRFETK